MRNLEAEGWELIEKVQAVYIMGKPSKPRHRKLMGMKKTEKYSSGDIEKLN